MITKLPDKWFIKNDNQIIRDWFAKEYNVPSIKDWNYHYIGYTGTRWNNGVLGASITYPDFEDFTELTFEEFKLLVLKENTMNKEIIGYKLIKPEYTEAAKNITRYFVCPEEDFDVDSNCYKEFKKAGVLDLWFEPVYTKDEFKIGDYAMCIKTVLMDDDGKEEYTKGQIYKCEKHNCLTDNSYNRSHVCSNSFKEEHFRLATTEEIITSNTITIGGYKAEKKGNHIHFGCRSFSHSCIIAYKHLLSNTNSTIVVEGTNITIDILNKILKKLE